MSRQSRLWLGEITVTRPSNLEWPSPEMHDGGKIYFEVTTVELICRKDTSKLLEANILPRLTTGLKIISTQPLHLQRQ
jgi:hypothetical protein